MPRRLFLIGFEPAGQKDGASCASCIYNSMFLTDGRKVICESPGVMCEHYRETGESSGARSVWTNQELDTWKKDYDARWKSIKGASDRWC